jgi:hypothetical protein
MAILEVDIMQYSNRAPIVPTYKRPEYLARIVRLLNDYYIQMADIEEWEEEARALKEEYKLLGKCLDDLRGEPPLRMVAGYGTERVQSSPKGEPHLQSIVRWGNEYAEINKQRREIWVRARALEEECERVRGKWQPVTDALAILTPVQRKVIEARHRWGIKVLTLARGLHYERQALGMAYHRALKRLSDRI